MSDNGQLLFGLLGNPLGHSLSPQLHGALLGSMKIAGAYYKFEVREAAFEDAIRAFKVLGFRGINVTIPYKQKIVDYLDSVSDVASLVGAVNTVLFDSGKTMGYNTDVLGFERALDNHSINIEGTSSLVLGAGGAARAVCCALLHRGVAKIFLHNRRMGRAEELARDFAAAYSADRFRICPLAEAEILRSLSSAQHIINTTSLGMWPNAGTSPFAFTGDMYDRVAMDLVYNPVRTRFLASAEKAGARTVDGLDMLIFQAVESMKIWLGRDVEFDANALRKYLLTKMNGHA